MVHLTTFFDTFIMLKSCYHVMLSKYASKKIAKAELTKFFKYLNLQQKNNSSKNSIDSRIASLYNAIQKLYDNYTELNSIIAELN